jgi:phenylpropionate dioxygenase-like ring-hydroxylating dioxygenase large terminal subunit
VKPSRGRSVNGALECGYHGWTYDAPGWRTIFQFHERWSTSPLRALEISFDNSHFGFVHRASFGAAAQPRPSRYELVETDGGFHAETLIDAANPPAYHRVSGTSKPITQRLMRNAYYLSFSRRLDIEYAIGVRHVIINAFTPIDDGDIQLCQWLFRNDTEDDCPAQLLIDFDHVITREDKDIIESTDHDAPVDTRWRDVEYSMDSDRPGMLIRKWPMALLARTARPRCTAEVGRRALDGWGARSTGLPDNRGP